MNKQKKHGEALEEKATALIDMYKMGEQGNKELAHLMNSLPYVKAEKKIRPLKKD